MDDDGQAAAPDDDPAFAHLAAPVTVVEPDPHWTEEYHQLALDLRTVLGAHLLQIEHIGSTSVPGLAAKDVIDIQVLVAALHPPEPIIDAFTRAGCALRAGSWNTRDAPPAGTDPDAPGWDKLVFAPPAAARPSNIHVRRLGSPNARQARLFRDHLRANPVVRDDWGRTKRELARDHPSLRDYGQRKRAPTNALMAAAERWATATRWEDPTDLAIRPRTDADVPRLSEVLAAQQPGSGYPLRWPLPVPVERFLVRPAETQAWVAIVGGQPVGHVTTEAVVERDDGLAQGWAAGAGVDVEALECLSVLFVDGNLRGHGIGDALLATAVAAIRQRGRVPVLDVVHRDGVAATVYRRRGWKEVGMASPPWLGEDHPPLLLMVLPPEAG